MREGLANVNARKAFIETLATATHLVCLDRFGPLFEIAVTERNEDGTPAASNYRASVDREFSRPWFEFRDSHEQVIIVLDGHLDNAYGDRGQWIELTYHGTEWGEE